VSLGESGLIQTPPKVLRTPKFCHTIDSGESTSKLLQSWLRKGFSLFNQPPHSDSTSSRPTQTSLNPNDNIKQIIIKS